jgi:hypothetical protein
MILTFFLSVCAYIEGANRQHRLQDTAASGHQGKLVASFVFHQLRPISEDATGEDGAGAVDLIRPQTGYTPD